MELASIFPTVESAVTDLVAVFATTARIRDMTYLVIDPAVPYENLPQSRILD